MGEENRVSVIYASQNKLPFGARRIGAKRDAKKKNEKQIEGRTETNFFSRERKEDLQVAVFF